MVFCVVKMKKVINKYRNQNGNNSQYSLNYKFDSISSAGKISGTALDLIKKYNELAKEALSNGNYTEMENFRQYAEHYRKIVTDINEKKGSFKSATEAKIEVKITEDNKEVNATENQQDVKSEQQSESSAQQDDTKQELTEKPASRTLKLKKEFKVVEIKEDVKSDDEVAQKSEKQVQKRVVRRKKQTADTEPKE